MKSPVQSDAPTVLLATFGTLGDLRPFMLLASALQRRGHRVLLIAPGFHAAQVIESGLPHALYGTLDDGEPVLADPDLWHPRKGVAVVLRSVVPCIAAVAVLVTERAAVGPCLLIAHPLLLPVADIVRAAGHDLPVVGAFLAPSNLRTCEDPLTIGYLHVPRWVPHVARRMLWRAVDRLGVDPFVLDGPAGLNALRAAAGLPPVRSFVAHIEAACDASVGLFAPWFGPRRQDWPADFVEGDFALPGLDESSKLNHAPTAPSARISSTTPNVLSAATTPTAPTAPIDPIDPIEPIEPTEPTALFAPSVASASPAPAGLPALPTPPQIRGLPPALATFLDAGSAPLVFTAGTGMRQAERFFAQARDALVRLGRRGVFVTSHAAQLPPDLGPDIQSVAFVDFASLLPRVAVLVHHGGIGTTAEALRAGVAQLVMPFGFDQFDNAARVQALGVGDVLPAARSSVGRLTRALARLTASPSIRTACHTVAGRFDNVDGPDRLAAAVETAMRLARDRRLPGPA